jgi:hypothetical protein
MASAQGSYLHPVHSRALPSGSRPNHVYVINYKTSTGSWEPLFDKKGKPLYPVLMAELDAMKALRPRAA